MDDENKSEPLQKLKRSLTWEIRSLLWLAPIGVLSYLFNSTAGLVILIVAGLAVSVINAVFSVVVTMVFLRPIVTVLKEGGNEARHSAGYRYMQTIKWHTLIGSTMCVVSSTLLYLNIALFFGTYDRNHPSIFLSNEWLNPFVFGLTADSVCNDVGLLFACGLLKSVSICGGRVKKETGNIVTVVPSFVSQAPTIFVDADVRP
jgi:hypothetical protein